MSNNDGSKKKIKTLEQLGMDSLAPKSLSGSELVKIEPYLERLIAGIKDLDTLNIALMGNYGAGKSTILKNLKTVYPNEFNPLNLSLASFSEDKEKANVSDKKLTQWELLENSLLKQIIYIPNRKATPFSRFRKIEKMPKHVYLCHTAILTSLLFSWFTLINYLSDVENKFLFWIIIAWTVASTIPVIYQLLKTITSTYKLSKLSVSSLTVEADKESNSYFSKYIDEIIYFFESTEYDTIIIEDIDRFKNVEIFEHLRELNFILNNTDSLSKRNITFIYAIREDIFKYGTEETDNEAKLRTKFFDLVLPVIPVINSFNSRDVLLTNIEKIIKKVTNKENSDVKKDTRSKKLSEADNMYFKSVAPFIDDMRLLENTINEFSTYIELMSNSPFKEKYRKLFSILLYKNLFPSEFSDLQRNKGFLYEFLLQRNYEASLLLISESKIEFIKVQIKKLEQEKQYKIDSMLGDFFFRNEIPYNAIFSVGSYSGVVNDLEDEFFKKIKEQGESIDFTWRYPSGHSGSKSIEVRDILTMDGQCEELEFLNNKDIDERIKELKQERKSHEENIKKLKSLTFQEIYQDFPEYLETKIREGSGKKQDLVLFMLTNGYITEDYPEYISIFYEKTLSFKDTEFLNHLRSNSAPTNATIENEFSNIKNITDELMEIDFDRSGIVNISLFDYHKEKQYRVKQIFKQFFSAKLDIQEHFVEKLIEKKSISLEERFFQQLTAEYAEQSGYIEFESDTHNEQVFSKIIEYGRIDHLKILINDEPIFKDKVIEIEDVTKFNFDVFTRKFVPLLSEKNSELKQLKLGPETQNYTNLIIENSLFDFSKTNIKSIFKYYLDEDTFSYNNVVRISEDTTNKIPEQIKQSFKNYVDALIWKFVENQLFDITFFEGEYENWSAVNNYKERCLYETEESFVALFNLYDAERSNFEENEELDNEFNFTRIELIKFYEKELSDITLINNQLYWHYFFQQKNIHCTWENIVAFYNSSNDEKSVIKNYFEAEEIVDVLKESYNGAPSQVEILKDLVEKRKINISESNIELFKKIDYKTEGLSNENVAFLVKVDALVFNEGFLEEYTEPSIQAMYIENHSKEYNLNFPQEISFEVLLLLMQFKSNLASIAEERLFDSVSVEELMNTEQLDKLFETGYEFSETSLFELINIEESLVGAERVSELALSIAKFIGECFVKRKDKYKGNELFVKLLLFVDKYWKQLPGQQLNSWLMAWNEPYRYLHVDYRSKVELDDTEYNKQLVSLLRRKKIISKSNGVNDIYMKRKF